MYILTFNELTRISLSSSFIRETKNGMAPALMKAYFPLVVIAILFYYMIYKKYI